MIEEACRLTDGEIDAIFLMGDFNFTLVPTPGVPEPPSNTQSRRSVAVMAADSCKDLLPKELKRASLSTEPKLVQQLSEQLQTSFLDGFGTYVGREELFAMDSCPAEIAADDPTLAIAAVHPVGIPAGSFPTYRFCDSDELTLHHLRESGCGSEDPGVFFMRTSLELNPAHIRSLFFHDSHTGKSGAIKKRGTVVRLNLGWLDRLYIGTRRDGANATVDAVQGTPVFLLSEDMKGVDHSFVPWRVSMRHASAPAPDPSMSFKVDTRCHVG